MVRDYLALCNTIKVMKKVMNKTYLRFVEAPINNDYP